MPEQSEGRMVTSEAPSAVGLSRSYRRRPEVEAEIVALPAGDGSELLAALRRAAALETVVHGIRRLLRAGRPGEAQAAAAILVERAAPLVTAVARSQWVDAAEREDLIQIATLQIWQEVFDLSPRREFWEVFFARMVRLACSDAADQLRRQREHERPFRRGVSEEGEAWSEEETVPDPQPPEPALLVPEALAQLDGPVRRALYLKTLGFKERSKDTGEPTISSLLGVSDRTVRNYLRSAEDTLRAWLQRGAPESERVQA